MLVLAYYINEYGSYISTTGGMDFLREGDPLISYMTSVKLISGFSIG